MKVVIDIPKEEYNKIIKDPWLKSGVYKYIKNGTSLPKGHGRLIDADAITKDLNTFQDAFVMNTDGTYRMAISCKAPTIIEADKAESEDKE